MQHATRYLAATLLLAGSLLLTSCGGKQSKMSTSTPSSTMGTDSAASQAGGTMPADSSKMK